jgi:hypothetical protein
MALHHLQQNSIIVGVELYRGLACCFAKKPVEKAGRKIVRKTKTCFVQCSVQQKWRVLQLAAPGERAVYEAAGGTRNVKNMNMTLLFLYVWSNASVCHRNPSMFAHSFPSNKKGTATNVNAAQDGQKITTPATVRARHAHVDEMIL